ncbi:MAG: type II toxin-antitoxin system PemK/MazF family toxin [Alkalinema sp. CAN_BIN05]|nr:type II toxin-antitoxin system PemK/MazF family toxin [Alkalinema sp. CAN_BIN05]
MAVYNQFDVVVVPFPFTDSGQTKRRPALIISNPNEFDNRIQRSVMAMTTTSTHSPWPLDIPIADLSPTGLNTESIVRMKLFTLDQALIVRKIGTLSFSDQTIARNALKQLMRLND